MEVLLKVKFPPNYPIIYKMVKLPIEMTVRESITFITEKYALQQWIGKSKMGLFESAEQAWLEDGKSLAFYFPDMSLVENIEFKDKNAVKGPLQHARGPYGMDLFSPQEVEKLRERLTNLGSVGKVLDKRQAYSMRYKVDDRTKLEEVQKILEENEKETAMAAEIGQTLLEKNVQMEQELAQLHSKVNEYQRLLIKMEETQTENLRIRTRNLLLESQLAEASNSNYKLLEVLDSKEEQLETTSSEMKESTTANLKQRERVIRAQEGELESIRAQLDDANTTADALKKSNLRLTEKIDLLESQVKSLKGDLNERTENDPARDLKSKVSYLANKNKSLEEQVVLLQSQTGATSDLKKGITVLQSVFTEAKVLNTGSADEERQLIVQAKKTLDAFLENPDSPPLLAHLVKQLQIPEGGSPLPNGDTESYPPTVILLIVSLFAMQKQSHLEHELHQEKSLQSEVVEQLRKRLEVVEKQNHKLKDLNDGLQALHGTGKADLEREKIELQREKNELEREKNELEQKLDSVASQLQTITETKDHEITLTHNRLIEIQNAISGKDEEIARLHQEIARLRQRIEELEKLLAEQAALPAPTGLKELPKDYTSVEEDGLINYINFVLKEDAEVHHMLPLSVGKNIINSTRDGLLVCKLINRVSPGTIDERVLNRQPTSLDEVEQNQSLCLNSAKAIGCRVQALSASSLSTSGLDALELIYEIAKVSILSKISITHHPELAALVTGDEEVSKFASLPPATVLQRWLAHHLGAAKSAIKVTSLQNIGELVKDGTLYGELLSQIGPAAAGQAILKETNPDVRAQLIINAVEQLVPYRIITDPKQITSGSNKLNLALLASLCDVATKLTITADQTSKINATITQLLKEEDAEGSREERAFVMWINSLNIGTYVTNLTTDMRDGLVILQVLDRICPGVVPWGSANMAPSNAYKMLENCNLGVKVAKSAKLGFSLVGIDGSNFHHGDRKLILALIWQACKFHILSILKTIGGGKEVSEADMTAWANGKVASRSIRMDNFKDLSLSTGIFLINLVDEVHPGVVINKIISPGVTAEEKMLNAKYAISLTRKIGGSIFLVWEDIVEVKPKMILTLIGTLMALDAKVLM